MANASMVVLSLSTPFVRMTTNLIEERLEDCSMRRSLIAGNWKMNGSKASIDNLLQALIRNCGELKNVELVVLPPFVYLDITEKLLSNTPIAWGAQNVSNESSGAFTGEIAASMLSDFHCRYVIVGHSERRHLYGENNQKIAAKFTAALKVGLNPILCVGETQEEREQGKTLKIVEEQLAAVLSLQDNLQSFVTSVIAYEPIWAIGTGHTATPDQAQAVHKAIREQLASQNKTLAGKIRIIYGGSMTPDNAAALCSMTDIDGGLIGGASLDAKKFIEIGQLCNNLY